MTQLLIVIPARYASTRFPGKPMALLAGKPVIQWVWERCHDVCIGQVEKRVVVATDDDRICAAVKAFGGEAIMTSEHHRSGTDRCGEVLDHLQQQGAHFDLVINVQGDEPFTRSEQLQSLVNTFVQPEVQIATLKTRIRSMEELMSPNNVKVVTGVRGQALYFSRQPLPYLRGAELEQWIERQDYFKHVGIYAFRAGVLREIVKLEPSILEKSESLEQLRWIENGYTLQVVETEAANIGIDTPADLEEAERALRS